MSLFQDTTITCTSCGAVTDIKAVNSVNADRRPDLRAKILENTFQVFACNACQAPVRLEPQFNYLEVGAGQWIAAYPGRLMPDFLEIEDRVNAVFDSSYGSGAMASAQDVGLTLQKRLTFGWPAVREKLVLQAAGLFDSEVEMLKLDVLRRVADAPMAPGIELRVIRASDEGLLMQWLETESETVLQTFTADPALLRAIQDNPDDWAPIRVQLENGPFVDMQKLYMGEGRAAAE